MGVAGEKASLDTSENSKIWESGLEAFENGSYRITPVDYSLQRKKANLKIDNSILNMTGLNATFQLI